MANSIKIIQDINKAIQVIYLAGKWLKDSGKNPSKWWQPQNLNKEFLLQYAKPEEFFVALVNGTPAAAMILQSSQNSQGNWHLADEDKDKPQQALYIHWLCVDRQFAGMDLPKILIDFAAKKAKENRIALLRVDTNANKVKLQKIYELLGFSPIAIIPEDYRKTALYQKVV